MVLFQILYMLLPMLGLVLLRHTVGKKSKLNFISASMVLFLVLGLVGVSLHKPGAQFTPLAIPALFILPLQLPATYLFFTVGKKVKPHVETLAFSALYLSSYIMTIYWLLQSGQIWSR